MHAPCASQAPACALCASVLHSCRPRHDLRAATLHCKAKRRLSSHCTCISRFTFAFQHVVTMSPYATKRIHKLGTKKLLSLIFSQHGLGFKMPLRFNRPVLAHCVLPACVRPCCNATPGGESLLHTLQCRLHILHFTSQSSSNTSPTSYTQQTFAQSKFYTQKPQKLCHTVAFTHSKLFHREAFPQRSS